MIKWILSYAEFDGSTYYLLRGNIDAGTVEEDYREMYFHSLNIIEKKEVDQGMSLIMIVFSNQENVSDEQAEQYVKWSEEGKRPDDIEIYYFLNLRYGLMSGDDELKILDEVERTADRMAVYRIAKDFTNTYFQEEYTGEVEIMGIKGLSGVDTDSKGDCTVEVEFRPVQEDSLSYLFLSFGYDELGWTIRSYGLEKRENEREGWYGTEKAWQKKIILTVAAMVLLAVVICGGMNSGCMSTRISRSGSPGNKVRGLTGCIRGCSIGSRSHIGEGYDKRFNEQLRQYWEATNEFVVWIAEDFDKPMYVTSDVKIGDGKTVILPW